jgi:CIC family chloride channel protein
LLTSIIFAIETTQQANALLPLLAACVASYIVSYLLMKNTIMTEKISRRGVATPHIYEPDILNNIKVKQVLQNQTVIISNTNTIAEVRTWLMKEKRQQQNFYVVADNEGSFKGVLSSSNLFSLHHDEHQTIESLIKRKPFSVSAEDSLKKAVETMARENLDVLPVVSEEDNKLMGVLSYKNILSVYRLHLDQHEESVAISLKRRTLKILLRGRKRLLVLRSAGK